MDLHTETSARTLALLRATAETPDELEAITQVAHRAGLLWTCPTCHTDNHADRDTCHHTLRCTR